MVAGAPAGEVVLGWLMGLSGIQADVAELGGGVFHVDVVGEATGGGQDEAVRGGAQQRGTCGATIC